MDEISRPKPNPELEPKEKAKVYIPTVITDVVSGLELSENEVSNSIELYQSYHNRSDSPQRIGLYGEDLENSLRARDSVLLEYQGKLGERIFAPVLVPAEHLFWFNMELLSRSYPDATEFLYFAHPPMPQDTEGMQKFKELLNSKLEAGAVIFTDTLANTESISDLPELLGESVKSEFIASAEKQSLLDVYLGPVNFNGVEVVVKSKTFQETYRQLLENGEITIDENNGSSLCEVITGEDAERFWQIYENPFKELSKSNPIEQGFSHDDFIEILADPEVVKIVNRVDGKISTIMLFVTDFEKCPWFNAEYYRVKYPEYFNTNNVLMFPGIVSDENMRGEAYSVEVMNLGLQIAQRRGTNLLLTFECAETSTEYIPKIVDGAINSSDIAKVSGLEEPVSTIKFIALSKA